ncbi:MAG: hypothetical protein ACP5VE_09880 [Chthonomonadales bacterium]
MPESNAYDDFALAASKIAGLKHVVVLASPRRAPLHGEELKAAVEEAASIHALIRRALQEPCMVPPIRDPSGMFTRVSTYPNQRALARILVAISQYNETRRHFTEAADAALDGMEMSHMLNRGASVLGLLVDYATYSICSKQLRRVIDRVPPRALPRIAARLDRIRSKVVPFGDILMEEGWVMVEMDRVEIAGAANPRVALDTVHELTEGSANQTPSVKDVLQAAAFALADKRALIERHLQYFRDVAAETRGPYTGRIHTPPPRDILGRFLAVEPRTWAVYLEGVADLDLMRVYVAILRYRTDHGAYPAALQSLVPGYLASLPEDPFGGGRAIPFRYHIAPLPTGFVLYSLGPDLKDDGGKPSARSRRFEGPGDIVMHPYLNTE